MVRAEFVPAQGEQLNSVYSRGMKYKSKSGKEFDMKYFTKDSFFEHKFLLQTAWYGLNGVNKGSTQRFRDMIGFPKDKIFISDSAGFQMASFKRRGEVCPITALDSLRWQEENADIGMNLDIPPNIDGNPSYEDFMSALNDSVINFKFFEDNRVNYDMKLYNVMHGEKLSMMEIWYNKVKHFNFDGWAIGIKPPFDPMLQSLGFMFLHDKGEFNKPSFKGLHFFGTSGKHVVPALVYLASKLKSGILTYDSSSYNIGSIYRTYYSPFDFGPHLSFGEKFKTENPKLKILPCMCPVCSNISSINELNTVDIYAGTLISLHNMFQYVQYHEVLSSLVEDKEKFLDYLKKINISDRTLKSIEFIDYALAEGVEKAAKRYEADLLPEDVVKSKQVDLWRF
jgi:tRNA-guanine family transglycosylase